MKQKIIIITGPTAVGKTNFSIQLAKKINGEIISADSMQIYKEANIATAKISVDEMQGIKHHLIDICEPYESFSAGQFATLAKTKINEIIRNNKFPIIVGGTGLYLSSLLFPLTTNAGRDDELRKCLNDLKNSMGQNALYNKLKEIDEETAKNLHPNQTDRIIRAIEIFYQTGIKKSQLIKNTESEFDYLLIVITDDRAKLYNNINIRVDKMISDGLIDEVKYLVNKYSLTYENQIMQGIGYKETLQFLNNEIDKEKLIELIKQHTRNYAKRQLTWFKKMPNAIFINKEDLSKLDDVIKEFIGRRENE